MSDDLIKRLLHLDMHPESAPRQAAECLKALEARAEKAEAERAALGRKLNAALYGEPHFGVQALEARIEALEAEVLRLREALREAQEFLSNLNEDEPRRKMPAVQASAMCIHIEQKCRAALKETDT